MPLRPRASVAFVLMALALLMMYFPGNAWLWRGLVLAGCSAVLWFLARGELWARLVLIAVVTLALIAVLAGVAAYPYPWFLTYGALFFLTLLLPLLAWPVRGENNYGQAMRAKCQGSLTAAFALMVSVTSAVAGYICVISDHDTGGLEGGAGLTRLGAMIFAVFMLFVGAAFGALVGRTLDVEEYRDCSRR